MAILGIETSSPEDSGIVLAKYPSLDVLGERLKPADQKQSQFLLPAIAELLQEHHLEVRDLKAIAVDIGPGSFTGVRVGMATVEGLAKPFPHIRLLGISSLDILASRGRTWFTQHKKSGFISTMIDARKGEIYGALYKYVNNQTLPENRRPACVCNPEVWLKGIKNMLSPHEPILFLGDGALAYRELLQQFLDENSFAQGVLFPVDATTPPAASSPGLCKRPFDIIPVLAKYLSDEPRPEFLPMRIRHLRPVSEEFPRRG